MSDSSWFLIFNSQYETVSLALAREKRILHQVTIHKHKASSELIGHIDTLLSREKIQLSDCKGLIGHAGPGPFTTLRVVLATINGLAYATHLPLVGVSGLEALGSLYPTKKCLVLLNAFCEDVYFGLLEQGVLIEAGAAPVKDIFPYLKSCINDETPIIGNAVITYQAQIQTFFDRSIIPTPSFPLEASIEQIAYVGFAKWDTHQTTNFITPLYLKAYSAHMPV